MTSQATAPLLPHPTPGIHVLPVLHARVEIAAWARSVLDRLDPAGVAVELPTTLEQAALTAVERLPKITLVIDQRGAEEALVWTCSPGDPFAEALRWAGERGRERFFVDPDVPYTARHRDPVPDPYALLELGAEAYMGPVLDALSSVPADDADRRREAGMALHALRARRRLEAAGSTGPLAVLVGAAHARRLAAELEERTQGAGSGSGGAVGEDRGATVVPFGRVERPRVEARHLHPESLTALLADPPLAHAAWELLRDGELPPEPELDEAASEPLSVAKAGLTLVSRGPGGEAGEEERRRRMERTAALAAHRSLRARPPDPERPRAAGARTPDRRILGRVVWEVGARSYTRQTREETARWQRRTFFDFARRLARTGGALAPGLYEWVVAARGVADDNLAWEVFEAARSYPWQEEAAELPTARVDGSDLVLPDELGTRTVRFRRRHFHVKRRPVAVPVVERPRPKDPADWLEGFSGGTLCSFPPEDLVIEDYGRFLRQRAAGILSAERTTVEPFSTSLLDGVDVRETLRHPEDPRVWVREQGRSPGKAGSVVVIFDRDLPAGRPDGGSPRYPYLMTWLGEHHDESDMAFYSTHPAEQVVGPGIMRATYGGFLMTVPPGRLFDVWRDPDYRGLFRGGGRTGEKVDVLLAAGIDYSQEKLVVHVAERPPRGALRRYAAARGKRIVHVPIGSLSPRTLKKIRVLHILVGRDKRAIAGRYVW